MSVAGFAAGLLLTLGALALAPTASACEPTVPNATGNLVCGPLNAAENAGTLLCPYQTAPQQWVGVCVPAITGWTGYITGPTIYFVLCPVLYQPALDCYL